MTHLPENPSTVLPIALRVVLVSDALFARGDGVAGLVDSETVHDADGLPYIRGKSLKGLLVEECASILAASLPDTDRWTGAATRLFGQPGATDEQDAVLHVGNGGFSPAIRETVRAWAAEANLDPQDVLRTLTSIRRQTAISSATGAPEAHSLRSLRVVMRGITMDAPLTFKRHPEADDLPLLAACVRGIRRGGTRRNRGLGRLYADLLVPPGVSITNDYFDVFRKAVEE